MMSSFEKDEESLALALAYRKKFREASSATHKGWLAFFNKSLDRQVRCCLMDMTALPDVQRRYLSLYHAHDAAQELYREAQQKETERTTLLRELRSMKTAQIIVDEQEKNDANKARRKLLPPENSLQWLVSLHSDQLFHLILSFL